MKYLIFFGLWLCLGMWSCKPNVTEIWIHEDNSGKCEITFDMGGKAQLLDQVFRSDQGGSSSPLFGRGQDLGDSIINLYEVTPDSILRQLHHPDLLKNVNLAMHLDEAQREMWMKLDLHYDHLDDLDVMARDIEKAKKMRSTDQNAIPEQNTDLRDLAPWYHLDMQNGIVRMHRSNPFEDQDLPMEQLMEELKTAREAGREPNPEMMMVLQMFLGEGGTTILHLPREVWFTNDPEAVVEGRTVTLKADYLGYLLKGEEPPTDDLIIKMKDQ